MKCKFDLGSKLKDKLTGFNGTVVARTEYLTGCIHYGLLSPDLDEKGIPREWQWFDETRLELISDSKKEIEKTDDYAGGPCANAPSM